MFYYWFNWEETIFKYVIAMRKEMIEVLEKEDPNNPFINDLKESLDLSKIQAELMEFPKLHLVKNILIFPLNFVFLCYIMIHKLKGNN